MKHDERYYAARKRAEELLAKMTLAEKIGQMSQFGRSIYTDSSATGEKEDKQGRVSSYLSISGRDTLNALQKEVLDNSRTQIPALFAHDVIHGYKTTFPIPLAQSCSWDPEVTRVTCAAAAKESYRDGLRWTFSPMVDIARDPRWGRISEGYGEDTYLCCQFARAAVEGYQGDYIGQPDHVIACMKHYAAYGACEGGRDYNGVRLGKEDLFDIYLPPFHEGIKAGAPTVMAAFHEMNGVPCSGNRELLYDILRGDLGFDGFVVSDYASVTQMITHGYAEDVKDAICKAVNAGMDMYMAGDEYNQEIPRLIEEGKVSVERIDEAALAILTCKILLGLMEQPYTEEMEDVTFSPEHRAIARDAAARTMVLLENNGILPLRDGKKIAVIGPLADEKKHILGGWACRADDTQTVTVEAGLRNALPASEIRVALGCDFLAEDREGFAEAKALAAWADVVIFACGEQRNMSGEARNRTRLGLPGVQEELVHELYAVNPNLVLAVFSGRPLVLTNVKDKASAILMAWFPGTEAGNALADVLTGKYNPAGRLSVSMPYCVGQIPCCYNRTSTGRPWEPGMDWQKSWVSMYLDAPLDALYPFGYGLSYTSFAYSDAALECDTIPTDGTLRVSVTVTNTGDVAGEETVQLYVRDLVASRVRPIRELKGFTKLALAPGESRRVTLELPAERLAFTRPDMVRVVEPGEFKLWVARHALDEDICLSFRVK